MTATAGVAAGVSFRRLAEIIAERLAELLGAYVYVTDESGQPIVRGEPSDLPDPPENTLEAEGYSQRIPVHFNGSAGEVLVITMDGQEVVAPRTMQKLVDLLISQTLATTRLQDQHELKNKFIYDLLHGLITDEADVLREGEILGMDFSRPRAVILIQAEYVAPTAGPWHQRYQDPWVLSRAQTVIDSVVHFFKLPSDTICAYIGDGLIAVLKASTTQDLQAWASGEDEEQAQSGASWANLAALKKAAGALLTYLRHSTSGAVSIGIGRYHPGVLGLASSYQDARTALSLGIKFRGHNRVHSLDEVGSAAFVYVSDHRTKVDLARHLLSPLDREPDLLATVRAFLEENCCPTRTACRLYIHRNTLLYRLNKVKLLTGLDPHRFHDAMQIYLALLLRDMD
jgi:carbohydrate diacid regulator